MSTQHTAPSTPLIRMAKRDAIPLWKAVSIRLIAILLALIVSGLFIYSVTSLNPVAVYEAMFDGAFGTTRRGWVTIRDTMMLLCISIGLAPAFKMKFWNIGAEGQILIGGCATAYCMINFGGSLSTPVLFAVMAIASLLGGALWGIIPGIFKARWGTNETLFTLMMNYVGIQITSFCVAMWENPYGSNSVGVINQSTQSGWLPSISAEWIRSIPGLSETSDFTYGWNVIIVMALTIGMFIYLRYSKQGYEIAVVGESQNTARYVGIKLSKVYIRTMALSGAICGLAGFIAVSGASHTISTSTAGGRGFTAIIVCWIAKFNTFVMIAISLLLVFLEKGAIEIASQFRLNDYASSVITGIILFFIIGCEFFINYKLIFRSNKEVA
ncbi:ABC transporter permease [Bengtsoniella intestinalis]|uniref:ABC transporter permease n=1 Tax=Bengtsoniella intestinalis TaxID=3073143 RepID=UPI00391EFCE3